MRITRRDAVEAAAVLGTYVAAVRLTGWSAKATSQVWMAVIVTLAILRGKPEWVRPLMGTVAVTGVLLVGCVVGIAALT